MEHILQFGVNIDEQKIIDTATGRASEVITARVQEEIDSYTKGWSPKLDNMFREEIKKLIDDHKEQIIEDATKQLAANMAKTKAVKEMIQKLEAGE